MAIRVAIIGCGQWGMNHLRNFSALSEAEVVAVCDTRGQRLQMIHEQYPNVQETAELHEVLNDSSIQAVVVATPTAGHYEVVKAALEAGKDVLCEKPLTTTSSESEQLIQLAEANQRILMVGHVFVFNNAVQKLRSYIDENALGGIYYFSARRTNLGPIRSDVDALWDLATHDLSIFDYLLKGQMPVQVSGCAGAFLSKERGDVAFASLKYPNNVVANVQVSWLDPQKRRELTVVGSEKMAIFNDVSFEAPLWVYDKGAKVEEPEYESFEQFRVLSWSRDATVPNIPPSEPLKNEALHFLECVEKRQTPITDGRNGWRIVRVLEAISESMKQNGTPISLTDLPETLVSK